MTPRGKRFLARIDFERAIISSVNSSEIGGIVPVAGLSAGAIADWRRRAMSALPQRIVMDLGELLENASRRAGLMADNSRILVDPDYVTNPTELEAVTGAVAKILSGLNERSRS